MSVSPHKVLIRYEPCAVGARYIMFILTFIVNSVLLGVGLAMDAFSVSLANGLNEPHMGKARMSGIAGTFAFYQWFMPVVGWVCVHTIAQYFTAFQKFIPWIALALLGYIGSKMLIEGIRDNKALKADKAEGGEASGPDTAAIEKKVSFKALMVQGIATSIDALSVGFTISDYNFLEAFLAAVIIAAVTFIICIAGLLLGRKFGTRLAGKASILGGVILIGIGIEIFLSGIL